MLHSVANDAVTILGHCYCYPSVAVVAEVVSSFVLVTTFGVPNFASVKLHTALHILPIHNFSELSSKTVARKNHWLHLCWVELLEMLENTNPLKWI